MIFRNFHKQSLGFLVAISTFILILCTSLSTYASGVTVALTNSTASVSSTGTITLAYTSTVLVATTDNIRVAFSTSYTGIPSFTINSTAATSTNSTSGSTITYILTPGASLAVGSVSIAISGLTTPSTAGNYSFAVLSSTGDYGAALQYIGSSNVVGITAQVLPILTFAIRDSGDTTNVNTCDLGTLGLSAVSTCAYRLKVSTNAASGYTISVNTSGNLASSSHNMTNAAVGSGGTGGSDISNTTAGNEKYGVVVTPGSVSTGGTVTLASTYNAGATNAVSFVNTSAATLITTTSGNAPATSGDTTNTSLVTHKVDISTSTPPGKYTSTVTYTVVASF
jgi:hypothetical protein